jgi:hypothetical protein
MLQAMNVRKCNPWIATHRNITANVLINLSANISGGLLRFDRRASTNYYDIANAFPDRAWTTLRIRPFAEQLSGNKGNKIRFGIVRYQADGNNGERVGNFLFSAGTYRLTGIMKADRSRAGLPYTVSTFYAKNINILTSYISGAITRMDCGKGMGAGYLEIDWRGAKALGLVTMSTLPTTNTKLGAEISVY